MKESARYVKIVEWSEADRCYIGSAPGLIDAACHGLDERAVFADLCDSVDEAIAHYIAEGRPLPPPTSGRGVESHSRHNAEAALQRAEDNSRATAPRGP
jgi:hypothetical protein